MLFVGGALVSRQGIAFDYSSPAELYLSRRKRRHTDYRRFATAAEAILYAVEELRTRRSRSTWMQVGDELFNKSEIYRLYFPLSESLYFPSRESLSAAPIRQYETDVSTRLSVRIDLASGGHLGSGKIALLEAIQAQKSISGAARSLRMPYLRALKCVQAINNALCAPAVVTDVGGRNHGGAVLTPIGTQIVDRYRAMEASAQLAAGAELSAIEALARDGKTPYRAGARQR
jgi:molybdate transport system regulatory protein